MPKSRITFAHSVGAFWILHNTACRLMWRSGNRITRPLWKSRTELNPQAQGS